MKSTIHEHQKNNFTIVPPRSRSQPCSWRSRSCPVTWATVPRVRFHSCCRGADLGPRCPDTDAHAGIQANRARRRQRRCASHRTPVHRAVDALRTRAAQAHRKAVAGARSVVGAGRRRHRHVSRFAAGVRANGRCRARVHPGGWSRRRVAFLHGRLCPLT